MSIQTYEAFLRDPEVRAEIDRTARRERAAAVGEIAAAAKRWLDARWSSSGLRDVLQPRPASATETEPPLDLSRRTLKRQGATRVVVDDRRLVRIHDGRGVIVRVQEGVAWLTQDGSTDDICLQAGAVFVIERDGMTVVSNLRRTSRALVMLSVPARAHVSTVDIVADIADWCAGLREVPVRPANRWA